VDPADRKSLMALGEELDHKVQDRLLLVSFKTYRLPERMASRIRTSAAGRG
jgi:hypothetical protein